MKSPLKFTKNTFSRGAETIYCAGATIGNGVMVPISIAYTGIKGGYVLAKKSLKWTAIAAGAALLIVGVKGCYDIANSYEPQKIHLVQTLPDETASCFQRYQGLENKLR